MIHFKQILGAALIPIVIGSCLACGSMSAEGETEAQDLALGTARLSFRRAKQNVKGQGDLASRAFTRTRARKDKFELDFAGPMTGVGVVEVSWTARAKVEVRINEQTIFAPDPCKAPGKCLRGSHGRERRFVRLRDANRIHLELGGPQGARVSITVRAAPALHIVVDGGDPHLAKIVLPDSRALDIWGIRDDKGQPLGVQTLVVREHEDEFRADFDADGAPVRLAGPGGVLSWSTEARLQDRGANFANSALALRSSIAAQSGKPFSDVMLSRCGEPLNGAAVDVLLTTDLGPNDTEPHRYVAYPSGNGIYRADLPVPSDVEADGVAACTELGNQLVNPCNWLSLLAATGCAPLVPLGVNPETCAEIAEPLAQACEAYSSVTELPDTGRVCESIVSTLGNSLGQSIAYAKARARIALVGPPGTGGGTDAESAFIATVPGSYPDFSLTLPCDCVDSCATAGVTCGVISDGCDGALDCGSCTAPETCGGAGVPNQCGCTPITCEAAGAECGSIEDGCGNTLDCGPCPAYFAFDTGFNRPYNNPNGSSYSTPNVSEGDASLGFFLNSNIEARSVTTTMQLISGVIHGISGGTYISTYVLGPPGTPFRLEYQWTETVSAEASPNAATGAYTMYDSFTSMGVDASPSQTLSKTESGQGEASGTTSGPTVTVQGQLYSHAATYRFSGGAGTAPCPAIICGGLGLVPGVAQLRASLTVHVLDP